MNNGMYMKIYLSVGAEQLNAIRSFRDDYFETFTEEETMGTIIDLYALKHLNEMMQYCTDLREKSSRD